MKNYLKQLCLVTTILCLIPTSFANKKGISKWITPESNLTDVFINEDNPSILKTLRLYDDLTYEYIIHHEAKGILFKINKGIYSKKENTINLEEPSHKEFFSSNIYKQKLWIGDNLENLITKVIPRKSIMKRVTEEKFFSPFYINPFTEQITQTQNGNADKIDLQDFTNYLVKNCTTEEQKVRKIYDYITNTFPYDWNGAKTYDFRNDQWDVEDFMTRNRNDIVCSGFSNAFKELCTYAGIEAERVVGMPGVFYWNRDEFISNHAWNNVKVNGTWKSLDLTWDIYLTDPDLMIYTHFPRDSIKQHTTQYVDFRTYTERPLYVNDVNSEKRLHPSWFEQTGTFYGDTVFEIKIVGAAISRRDNWKGEIDYDWNVLTWPEEKINNTKNGGWITSEHSNCSYDVNGDVVTLKIVIQENSTEIISIDMKEYGKLYYKLSSLTKEEYAQKQEEKVLVNNE